MELLKEEVNIQNEVNVKEQNNFLETKLGKIINTGIDIGLRWILPDFLENQIIDIKDSLLKEGLKEGINKTITSAIDLGKSITGIFTGKFDNMYQAQEAVKKGGIIDGMSNILDVVLNKVNNKGNIPGNITNIIKQSKNIILDNISKNIEEEFSNQINGVEKLSKYENNWEQYFTNKDFKGMEKEYRKIKDVIKELLPIEETLKKARQIENLHNIIKNNGNNFNLTKEQLELANVLI